MSAGAGPVRGGGSFCGDRGRAGAGSRSQLLNARSGFVGNPWGDGRCVVLSCKRCGLQAGTRTLAVVFLVWESLVKGGWLRLKGPRGKVTAARESNPRQVGYPGTLQAGEVSAVAVHRRTKVLFEEWSQLRICVSALQFMGPLAQEQPPLVRNRNNAYILGLWRSVNEIMNARVACIAMQVLL